MCKKFSLIILLVMFSAVGAFAQKPQTGGSKTPFTKNPAAKTDEKTALNKALAETDLSQKIAALQKFIADFPKSSEKTRVGEILVSTRAQIADEKLRAGSRDEAFELFRQAVAEAPVPLSDKLFSEVILQFPTNLFYGGAPEQAFKLSDVIEEKVSQNAKQLLGLATFYLSTENGADAKRIAEKAVAVDPNMSAAYQTLGAASRMYFRLEEAANAYAKALELEPESAVSKKNLAEMKRALGKPNEAEVLYRELLDKNPEDASARAGLILAKFDGGKTGEAEIDLAKSLEQTPNNLPLLVGAAYWYAANHRGEKAVEYARRAVTLEPRYTWGRIALARALMEQKDPAGAERELLAARAYGNFPTIDYEIASARLASGFYEEAARELRKNFAAQGDVLETRLANRVGVEAGNFIELLDLERRASIFAPVSAENSENAAKLKSLLRFDQVLNNPESSEADISGAVREFTTGTDAAKIHRQLYAARRLMLAKRNLSESLELTQAAVSGVDSALNVPSPASAIMADELFESRTLAISRNELVVVPDVPRQTLSAILRGRIEEIAGWTLYQQGKSAEAVVRLKRAVSILPEKSAWWRSSTWRLGAALEAADRKPEALDIYVKSYNNSPPDAVRYSVIETLYKQVKGTDEGLEQKIGVRPASGIVNAPTEAIAQNTATPAPTPAANPSPVETSAPTTVATTESSPESSPTVPVQISNTTPEPSPSPTIEPIRENTPSPTPISLPTVEAAPEVKTEATPQTTPAPSPATEERKTEKMTVTVTDNTLKNSQKPIADSTPKPLFDPVVITVPQPETATKKSKAMSDNPKLKDDSVAQTNTPKDSTPIDGSGTVRSRVSVNSASTDSADAENPNCSLVVNQDSITILNQGGSLGIMLGYEGEDADLSKITATSGSPSDVEVTLDAEVGKQSKRSFYIIKSISPKKGIFTVIFESPCGKKEVQVKVR